MDKKLKKAKFDDAKCKVRTYILHISICKETTKWQLDVLMRLDAQHKANDINLGRSSMCLMDCSLTLFWLVCLLAFLFLLTFYCDKCVDFST